MEARGMARSQYSHAHLSRDTGENLMNLHRTILALLMTLLSVATFARDMGPRPDAQTREEVLRLREAAWRTWFGNDQEGFKRVVPNELVAFNWDGGTWEDRDMVLQGMSEFAGTGLKLTSLEFPDNVFQKYGETIILYTTFRVVLASGDGSKQTISGRGTEVFVKRRGRWIHTGWHLDRTPAA